MVDDPNDQYDNSNEGRGGGGSRFPGGGGGGIFSLLPLLFGLIKNPVLLVIVLLVGGYFYFQGGCNLDQLSSFATGGVLDPREFNKAPIYEATDATKNPLPEKVSLRRFAPAAGDQGQQGSCVAWSSAYAARTIVESSRSGVDPNKVAFSPSFLYNQIGLDGCQGSYIIRAVESMSKVGSVPMQYFPYDETDCTRQPNTQLKQAAGQFKLLGFSRLTDGDKLSVLDIHAIKEHLAKDVPVIIGMMVGGSFMQGMKGKEIWEPNQEDYSMMGFGGHAMCIIGYDDRKAGGVFEILNSWGPEWGINGIGYVKYADFRHFNKEAYGLNPMPLAGTAAKEDKILDCAIGLVETSSKKYIPLKFKSGNVFQTSSAIAKGTTFKMEVKNSSACYIYIIGMETDGSSYILFPYPSSVNASSSKFSPYCGITGYRLFPRGMSMQADDIGNRDQMAVLVSKDSLNIFELNKVINAKSAAGFSHAISSALSQYLIPDVRFSGSANGTINIVAEARQPRSAGFCIVEIEKK
jgi:hypothetical protein